MTQEDLNIDSISIADLKEVLVDYDLANGCFPPSMYHGQTLYEYVLKTLGYERDTVIQELRDYTDELYD